MTDRKLLSCEHRNGRWLCDECNTTTAAKVNYQLWQNEVDRVETQLNYRAWTAASYYKITKIGGWKLTNLMILNP